MNIDSLFWMREILTRFLASLLTASCLSRPPARGTAEFILQECGRVPLSYSLQASDCPQGRGPLARAERLAVEPCRSATEVEDALPHPTLQYTVAETRVKHIAGPGRVYNLHAIRGSIPEARSVPQNRASNSQRRADGPALVLSTNLLHRAPQISLPGELHQEGLRSHRISHLPHPR